MTSIQNIKYSCFVFVLSINLGCDSSEYVQPTETQSVEVEEVLTIGGTKNESAQSVVSTSDGGYAILGYTQSMDGDIFNKTDTSYDYWLLKFDASGQQQWQKVYGGSDDDRGEDLITTNDGGYAILGSSKSNDGNVSNNSGSNDFWVAKLDASGTIVWEKSFGYIGADSAFSIIQTQDNGFLLSGVLDVSASDGAGNNRMNMERHAGGDYWVVKIDAMGDLQWSRYFGGTFTDTAYDSIQTQDGNFLIMGSSDSDDVDINNNKGTYDFWVVKLNNTGTLLWEKSFGGTEIDEARTITSTADGNFLIAGDSRSNDIDLTTNNGAADVWIIKINSNGDLLWEKTFGGSSFDGVKAIHKTQNNEFLVAGNSRSSDGNLTKNNGQNDAWIFKINAQGNVMWQRTIGGNNIDLLMGVTELNNGSIIGVGNTNSSDIDISENKGFSDLLIIKAK
ncbi:MAG: hypothetical protein O2906_06375 [Bacteroidetes bacterium]|nr:hypothetical protein [Bacteroidota bacterium]MDA0860586.1 hypothetical protein [Bacteroidota bacterium]MDA1318350.1 hypothetical protein [Bacteroidota bacterium]